ncbi:hypothetical protein NQ314_018336 [Rhamnusium bicolor]|uniref:RNA-directed DNA polymerase n=1 Tax=Rhamnusium bicolor TaxID=1586634 RepID=A0AAV8WS10_9CUCU|nr:hypothetical protein NQ314_018336 [Rhamnusium bicolor]
MDPQYLKRDELEYELSVRGITEFGAETLRSMRRLLKDKQKNEGFGKIACHNSFDPDIGKEIDICNKKVVDLERLLETFQGEAESEEAKYIFSVLQHLYGRLNRLHIDDDIEDAETWRDCKNNLLRQLESLETTMDRKCFSFRSFASSSQGRNNVYLEDNQDQSTVLPVSTSTVVIHQNRTPVSQWGITFDAKKTGLSVSAFLEKIETYRVARNVSEEELKNSIIDLLKGDALIWYTSIRSQVDSWHTFVNWFKEEYLPHDHHEKLWELIRARNQNQNESIGTYFACMTNLFNRLGNLVSEQEKLYILKRNILPYYIHQLGSQGEINSVDELRKLCKKWEINREIASRPRTTLNANISALEPDLAGNPGPFNFINRNRTATPVNSVTSNDKTCWNCNELGHRFQNCRKKRERKFCFRCGKAGVTSRTTTLGVRKPANDSWIAWLNFVGTEYRRQRICSMFTTREGDPRPYLTVKIYGLTFVGLLDSGASRTVIGSSSWAKFQELKLDLKLEKNISAITVANGSSCDVLGVVQLPIKLDNKIRLIKAVVVLGYQQYNSEYDWKIIVPKKLRGAVLLENHNDASAGHLGFFKTMKRIASQYYWPRMNVDIARDICENVKDRLQKSYQQSSARYNLRHRPMSLEPGQIVWKKQYTLSDAANYYSSKLGPKFVKCRKSIKVFFSSHIFSADSLNSSNTPKVLVYVQSGKDKHQ